MHLKRLAIPKTWPLPKKICKFAVVPKGKKIEESIPLAIFLRDFLKEVKTFKEAKKVIKGGNIEINGKIVKDEKFAIGLFDRVFISKLGKYFTLHLNKKKKIEVKEIDKERYQYKISKIIGKTTLKEGKIQLNLYGGDNILVEKDKFKIGDSIKINLKNRKIEGVLPITRGAIAFLIKGKSAGNIGKIVEVGKKIKIEIDGTIKEVPQENLIVVDENEFK